MIILQSNKVMIDNKLISSKAVLAKIIADLDLKEDEIRITDVREWIGEAMEKIGAVQQLEHKVANIQVVDYQAKLPCDLYRLNQVAFSFENGCGWLPMRKVTNSFGVYKKCGECNPIVKNIFNVNTDDANVKQTLSALVNQYTIPSNNGRLIIGNPATFNTSLQYSTKPGYITVNVPCGWLKISYHAIITDEDSMPMIPDIPSYFEAIFWYVAMKMSYPKYLKGQLNQNIYYDMRNSWNFYRRQAYAEAMMPTVDELKSIQNTWDRLYPENDEHCTFFEHLGDEQIIYNWNN